MALQDRDYVERAALRCDSSMEEIATDELARLARSGNAKAFDVLANRLRPRLLVALGKRLHGRVADAEDVVQETLAKVWHRIASYDGERSFVAWVYTIAFRQATDHLRRRERQAKITQRLQAANVVDSTVQQTLIDEEASDNVWAVAKRVLTDPQYVALWLRYAEDFSVSEIAATMGKTQVGVRVLLHRARTKVKRHADSGDRCDEK